MSTFAEHGVQFGLPLGLIAFWIGCPAWVALALFLIGFFDGSRADWLGDYTLNHMGIGFWPYTPGNWLHWAVMDPIVHRYSPDWFKNGPQWLRVASVALLSFEVMVLVVFIRELFL